MTTGSYTESTSFTVTHARHMAAKVATDLKRMQRFYGQPSDLRISEFEAELVELLKEGAIESVWYGFKRAGNWIVPTLRYNEQDLFGGTTNDDDPGLIRPNADISGASFYSYLTHKSSWYARPRDERQAIEARLPFKRGEASEPGVNGYFTQDRIYSAGGHALSRSTVRSY
jgi:hypothetical protein